MSAGMPTPDATTRNRILLVLFIGVFMAALDTAVIGPAIPTLRAAFGIDNSQVALVTIVYVLFALISAAPMASLSDRYSRRPVYLLTIALFATGSLIVALAPNFWILLLGRALQGTSAGGITPTASAVIGDAFPVEQRGKALGLLGATFGMAFLVGPVLASLILVALSWQWLFLINLPIALLILVLGARVLPNIRPPGEQPPFDFGGTLIGFALLVSLTLGINRVLDGIVGATVWPWFLGAAMIGLPLLIWLERRVIQPIIPLNMFSARQLRFTYLLTLGAGFAMGSVIFITSIAVAAFAFPQAQVGFLLVPMVICSSAASMLFGRFLNRLGSRMVLLIGFTAVALGSGMLGTMPEIFWFFLLATMVMGLGVGVVVGGTLRYIVLNEAPPEQRGAAQGLIAIFTSIGNLLVVAVLGAIADSQGASLAGFESAYLAAAGVALLMALLTFGLKSRYQEQEALAGANPPIAEAQPATMR